jgi:hypothetical protein
MIEAPRPDPDYGRWRDSGIRLSPEGYEKKGRDIGLFQAGI